MKRFLKIFPWLATILALAAMYFFYSMNKDKDDELAKLRPQAQEISELKNENAELKKLESQSDELARLKKENVDLLKLRNEVRQLRSEKIQMTKQLQSAEVNAQRAEATAQVQAAKVSAAVTNEAYQRFLQSNGGPSAALEEAVRRMCINNLRQIDGAKQQWALENKKSEKDVPTEKDVAMYLKDSQFPVCPSGGTYSIKAVIADPTCTMPGHILPVPPANQ